ncbi:MAG: hypothetical protein Q7R85_04485 [bacterium]|nr:hypothetical protein [bacterium]
MSKVFLIFSIFIIAAAAGLGWYYFSGSGSHAVTIDVTKPDRVLIGVPFSINIAAGNTGGGALRDAKLSLELPLGAAFVGARPEKTTETKSLGLIGEGSTVQEEFDVIVLANEQSIKRFVVRINYSPESVGSRFEETSEFDVVADASGMMLDLVAPESAVSGEEFGFDVPVKNMAGIDFRNLKLTIQYPPGFEFKKASLAPDLGQHTWQLGDLRSGSETTLHVRGNLLGQASASFEFRVVLEAEFLGEQYIIGTKTARVTVAESPLNLLLSVNDSPLYIAAINETLVYAVEYENTSNQPLQNAVVKAELRGEMFDLSTLRAANAAVNPSGNAVVWSAATFPDLAVIPPHSSGVLIFTVRTLPNYPVRRLSDRNFLLKADVRMDAEGTPKGSESRRVSGLMRLETKVKGALALDAKAFFRDAGAGVLNNGPIPPRVNASTNYTVHWLVKNFSTDVASATVRARLGDNVRMTGVVKGVSPEQLNYNANTQEVVWAIARIPATKGITDAPLEAIFQIEATPSPNLLRMYMPLIGETVIEGSDMFTGSDIRATDVAITTSLPDDASIGGQGGMVVQ